MKLKSKAALAIPYDAPESGVMQVRVAASDSINVYAIRREALEQYKRRENAPAVASSPVAKSHEFVVQVPPGAPWNLIVENPWEHEVEVNYAVTALAPAKPVVISGSVMTSPATISGTLHVTGAAVTGSGTGTVTPAATETETVESVFAGSPPLSKKDLLGPTPERRRPPPPLASRPPGSRAATIRDPREVSAPANETSEPPPLPTSTSKRTTRSES